MAAPQIIVIAGPTAAGKSQLAMQLAMRHNAIILSADAMQVYRGMDIGTATPELTEQRDVQHLGINLCAPDETFSAADFVELAETALDEHPRVIIVGGTSLYIRSLIRGLVKTPPVRVGLREELEQLTDLHVRLQALDPVLAERLHPNDRVRIIRGLKVAMSETRRFQAPRNPCIPTRPLSTCRAVGGREDLYERIDTGY